MRATSRRARRGRDAAAQDAWPGSRTGAAVPSPPAAQLAVCPGADHLFPFVKVARFTAIVLDFLVRQSTPPEASSFLVQKAPARVRYDSDASSQQGA